MNKKTINKTEQTAVEKAIIDAEEKNMKLGEALRKVRQKMGLSLEGVADELKIRKTYLEAIENSDYKNVPEYPYGIGFINSYAKFLGLNEAEAVKKYKSETCKKTAELTKSAPASNNALGAKKSLPSLKNIYIAGGAFVVICILWAVFSKEEVKEPVVEAAIIEEVQPQVIIQEESYVPESAEIPTEVEETVNQTETQEPAVIQTTNNAENNVAKIKVFEETWVEVKTPTTLYLSKVLQAGEEYVLPKKDGLILSVGKINGADLFVGDKKMNAVKPNKKININLDGFLKEKEVE